MVATDEVRAIVAAGYAEHVRDIVLSQQLLQDEVRTLKEKLEFHGSLGGEKVKSSTTADAIPEGIAKLEALMEDWTTKLVEYAEHLDEFSKALENIDAIPKQALYKHYVDLQTWEEVCVSMHYSYEGIMKIRRRGLIQLYDYIPLDHRDVLPKAL